MKTNTTRTSITARRAKSGSPKPKRRGFWEGITQLPEPERREIANRLERQATLIRATCAPDPWARLDSGEFETVIEFEDHNDRALVRRLVKRGGDFFLAQGARNKAPQVRPVSLHDSVRWFAQTNLRAAGYSSTPARFSAWLSAALLEAGQPTPGRSVAH